ncbi:hypothetical protein BWP39_12450 [Paraburkholderia acidicola]|uniref:HTH araC/xylS-type domain-containing protein n=1 Tax=Paraburkholderia acidicola TaxID=1912599 RepID=A0A2A4EY30_9BURK|nr:AraC family transcriptional regulator [Paraburkholderia acidicola]PCE25330.1 hypothetical protein BWP39_12450 [Paraburkholderia acidicola]
MSFPFFLDDVEFILAVHKDALGRQKSNEPGVYTQGKVHAQRDEQGNTLFYGAHVLNYVFPSALRWGQILPIEDRMSRKKIDERQFIPEITAYSMAALMQFLPELGVSPQRACLELGFTPDELLHGMQISQRQAWSLIRRSLRLTGRPDLGLEVGRRQNLSHFGMVGFAMMAEPDLHHALTLAMRHYLQPGPLVGLDYEVDDVFGIVSIITPIKDASVQPFLVEEMVSSALALLRILLGPTFSFHAVDVAYKAPSHAARYQEVLDCPVHFACKRNRILINLHWFSVPLPGHSPIMAAQLKEVLEQQARDRDPVLGTAAAVENLLSRTGDATITIGQAAEALDLSVRTLARRLTDANTSFRELRDRVCAKVAHELLHDEGLTVSATAERLGFSDARSFRRAFIRWFGESPAVLRQLDRD